MSAPRDKDRDAIEDAPQGHRPLSSMSERELEEVFDREGIPIAPDIVEGWRRPRVERIGLAYVASVARLGSSSALTGSVSRAARRVAS